MINVVIIWAMVMITILSVVWSLTVIGWLSAIIKAKVRLLNAQAAYHAVQSANANKQ